MVHETETHAYAFIKRQLTEKKGWEKVQVFSQNEIRKIELIVEQLGDTAPENIVQLNETQYYVIEAKSKQMLLSKAIKEAREDYADKINKSKFIQAIFITGIAGNDDEGFVATSQYLKHGKWVTITENNVDVTAILSKIEVDRILESNNPHLKDVEITEDEFLKTAVGINKMLQKNSIAKDQRAKMVSAILLALSEGTEINLNESPSLLVKSINNRVEVVLNKHEKPEFARFISLDLPSTEDNHGKYKVAIVQTIQALRGMNIRSMMSAGKDLLGEFYEAFLKYGNGAKDIGIVFTPRHITRFAAEILDIQDTDLVFDPTCGTGGFLVSAYDEVRKKSNPEKFKKFRNSGLYGIEDKDPVVALALVNMIFRGDGKNNIIEGNCFAKWLNVKSNNGKISAEYVKQESESRIPPISKVMMNPPFAQPDDDNKEYKFVKHALRQMQDGGLLFSVLPVSTMLEGGEEREWRKNELLKRNTLLCILTFPPDLFYHSGTNVHSLGVLIKKGIPHPPNQNVLWIKTRGDGFRKVKRKRLRSDKVPNDIETIKSTLKEFLLDQSVEIQNIPEFQKMSPIDFSDSTFELIPEAFLDAKIPTEEEIKKGVDEAIRDTIAYLIRTKKEGMILND